jgi:hypothetical protein
MNPEITPADIAASFFTDVDKAAELEAAIVEWYNEKIVGIKTVLKLVINLSLVFDKEAICTAIDNMDITEIEES